MDIPHYVKYKKTTTISRWKHERGLLLREGETYEMIYDKVQNMPDGKQQKVGEHTLEKPMEVLFEGADEDIYKSLNVDE